MNAELQSTVPKLALDIVKALVNSRFHFNDEAQLHAGLEQVLKSLNVGYRHEHVAGPGERFDFLCAQGVVIEVKVRGSYAEALRQVERYQRRDDVSHVLLVTSKFWGLKKVAVHTHGNGKVTTVVRLDPQAF